MSNRRHVTLGIQVLLFLTVGLTSFSLGERFGRARSIGSSPKPPSSPIPREKLEPSRPPEGPPRGGDTDDHRSAQLAHDILACFRFSDPDERQRKFFDLIVGMRAEDAVKVRAVFAHCDKLGRRFPSEWRTFWRVWGKVDPQGAIEAAGKEPKLESGTIYGSIFQSWSALDPGAAAQWLNQNASEPGYDQAYLGYVSGYAQKDLMQATNSVLKTLAADDPLFGQALDNLSARAAEQTSATGVQDWFDTVVAAYHDNPQLAKRAVLSAAGQIANSSVTDAVNFVTTQLSQPWGSYTAVGNISYRYSLVDPAGDAAWIASLPPREGAYIGTSELIKNWSQSNSEALQQWLGDQKGTPLFGQAVTLYLQVLGNKSPALSAYWKQQLGESNP
jgi:hypothetical protein